MTFKSPVSVRPVALALAAGALMIAVCGCGSGGKSAGKSAAATKSSAQGPAAPASLTKAQFVAKANAICNATNGPLAATAVQLASHPSPAQAARIISGSFIPEIRSQLGKIKALGTPVGGQSTIAAMDRLLYGDIARIVHDPALAGPAVFHDFAVVAHGYGLTACAPLS
jgi:hypothetical protein